MVNDNYIFNYLKFGAQSKSANGTIVLLHGWGGSIQSLKSLAELLSLKTDKIIYVLEMPGFGDTPLNNTIQNTHDFAQYVFKFLDSQHVRKALILGHSFGGKIAVKMTLEDPGRVAGLILISPSVLKPTLPLLKSITKKFSNFIPKEIKNNKFLKTLVYKLLREHDYETAGDLKNIFIAIVSEYFDDLVYQVRCPTLIIWGDKDRYIPATLGVKLHYMIKNSQYIQIPNTGHGLPIFHSSMVVPFIVDWLQTKL